MWVLYVLAQDKNTKHKAKIKKVMTCKNITLYNCPLCGFMPQDFLGYCQELLTASSPTQTKVWVGRGQIRPSLAGHVRVASRRKIAT